MAMLTSSQSGVYRPSISLDLIVQGSESLVGRFSVDGGQVGVLEESFPVVRDSGLSTQWEGVGLEITRTYWNLLAHYRKVDSATQ